MAQEVLPTSDVQNIRPSIDARQTLLTDDAGLAPTYSLLGKVVFGYSHDLLNFTLNRNGKQVSILRDVTQANVILGYTIDRFRLGVDVPTFLSATSDILPTQSGLGDVAVDFRGTVIEPSQGGLGMALSARVTTPSATVIAPLASPELGYEGAAIIDYRIGGLLAAFNLGYRTRTPSALDNIVLDDQLIVRAGAGIELTPAFGLSADAVGYVQPSVPENVANAWEGLGGLWYRVNEKWVIRGGGGGGMTPGIGTAAYRMMFSVGYEPVRPLDPDGDGFINRADDCPDDAEDLDGFEDDDGCPDDRSPVRILIRDPYGYPVDDVSLRLIHDDSGGEVEGGAKFIGALESGVWLMEATAPGYEPLSDEFTVEEDEAVELVKAMDPFTPPPRVRVTRSAIRITEKIYFEVDSAIIMQSSYSILDLIAETLRRHPEVLKLSIEGHTDSRASDEYNRALSQRRAASVRDYIVNRGVQSSRLSSVGKGESEPLDTRETESAWELNRRVEFVIEDRTP